MKDLSQYLSENEKIYEFRLKIAKEVTDEQLDAMELHLRKYDGFDITTPKRTIIQKNPRDFRSINAAEIYMIDFKTKQPAAPLQLLAELSQKMGIHERFMILRNKLEPLHVENEGEEDTLEVDQDDSYKPRLTDDEYSEVKNPDADDYYGETFKDNFLKGLENSKKEYRE